MEPHALPAALAAALLDAGYRVGGPAGVGAGGPAWTVTRSDRAASAAPARLVAQVVALPDAEARVRLAERLEALWELAHPHLPDVVDVVVVPPGPDDGEVWAVLLAEVPGATVAALLAARGRLTPGEVVTLAVPVAGALAALHRVGLVHGDVSPANLVVGPDGRPVLIDVLGTPGAPVPGDEPGRGTAGVPALGTPGFTAPEVTARRPGTAGAVGHDGLPAGAPADVYALGSVALAALDLAAHGTRLGVELRAACAVEPVRRPTAVELAGALFACADPEPIALPDAGVLARAELAQLAAPSRTVSAPRGARHRAVGRGDRLRRRLGGVAAVSAVLAAGATAWAVVERGPAADGPPPRVALAPDHTDAASAVPVAPTRPSTAPSTAAAAPSPPAADPAPPPADPAAAAAALTRLRAEVLADGDPGRLAEVAPADSPAHHADRAVLERLTAAGVTLEGLAAVVEDATVVGDVGPPDAGRTVDVLVRSGLSAHVRRTPSGSTGVAAQPSGAVVLRLVWTDDGWRVSEVRPSGGRPVAAATRAGP